MATAAKVVWSDKILSSSLPRLGVAEKKTYKTNKTLNSKKFIQ